MSYVEGFVVAVPAANKDAYVKHASDVVPLFKKHGATRIVEAWGDEVPDGKLTDFRRAVKAKEDEVIVFSWIEYPSKEVRDAAVKNFTSDPQIKDKSDPMPFDGTRMIFGGFSPIVDVNGGGKSTYVDGTVIPVPAANKDAYRAMAEKMADVFRENGATRVVDAWGDDVPDGKVTDYNGAVQARDDEKVVYGWVEWPSKKARDEGWRKAMADPRMHPAEGAAPFDGKRMIYGGFSTLIDA